MKSWIFLVCLACSWSIANAETKLVFAGKPLVRVQDAGIDRNSSDVAPAQAKEFEVLITQDGEDFFWASRENKPLLRLENQNFITFVAIDGVGYIKIAKPRTVQLMKQKLPNYPFTYIEHLTAGLTAYTYFGVAR